MNTQACILVRFAEQDAGLFLDPTRQRPRAVLHVTNLLSSVGHLFQNHYKYLGRSWWYLWHFLLHSGPERGRVGPVSGGLWTETYPSDVSFRKYNCWRGFIKDINTQSMIIRIRKRLSEWVLRRFRKMPVLPPAGHTIHGFHILWTWSRFRANAWTTWLSIRFCTIQIKTEQGATME